MYTVLASMVMLYACKNENKKHEDKKLIFPSNMHIYTPFANVDESWININKSTYKIYTLIDASCSSCFSKFKQWNDFQLQIDSLKNVKVVGVCYSKDNFELVKYLFETNEIEKVNFPIFLDINEDFKKLNGSLIKNPLKFSVLTDSNNKILLIGDPINNKNDKELFLRNIRNLI